jgi:hypothetical protein
MNKNFKHKNIATIGGEQLESFVSLLEQMGWKGRDKRSGGAQCYYTINPLGILEYDVPEEHFTIVCATDFIHYYSDMLAPTPGDERDIISISRSEFKKIYDVACSNWKDKLSTWAGEHMFKDKLEFTHGQIKMMLDASTREQLPIVKEVFHEYKEEEKELNLREMEFDGEVFDRGGNHAMVSICMYDSKSFYLNQEYNWHLSTNTSGETILTPTKK